MEQVNWQQTGSIFNIQRFSLHDGTGIRTIVFLKGCGLRCAWCCNPESQSPKKNILFKDTLCIGCKACLNVCPTGALSFVNGKISLDHSKCTVCGSCTKVCCTDSLQIMGKDVTVEEVFHEVAKDQAFYHISEGGMTLSGGEALLQADFAKELLKACKNQGIPTAVETAGFVPTKNLLKVVPYIDTFLFDIKVVDEDLHKHFTTQSNRLILENLRILISQGCHIIIRIPVMLGINTTQENQEALIKLLNTLGGISEIHLLPYHRLGMNKYHYLGRDYLYSDGEMIPPQLLNEMQTYFQSQGYQCVIGG